ncbi:hypothetical protein Q1695_001961 [Nippostrongylus brasiliensis]|nr:hypothetical protein Q1695_001961 [Nippostrongylus brasiliensis]
MIRLFLYGVLGLVPIIYAASIENAVIGQPTISCGSSYISVVMEAQNPFRGSFYVKGFFHDSACRIHGTRSTTVTIDVPLNSTCGVRRRRTANPRGIVLETTVVVMFHPIFMTRVDRAYHVQCNYMETSKEVSRMLNVSTHSPTELPSGTADVDDQQLPNCKYEVLSMDREGSPVKFAIVGDAVYHKWSCESDPRNQYCMRVHSCAVDDGQGLRQELLDQDGCTLDPFLMGNLDYPDDLTAGQKAHVFKFADRPTIFFSCIIRLEFKDDVGCKRPSNYCAVNGQRTTMVETMGREMDSISADFPTPPSLNSETIEEGQRNPRGNLRRFRDVRQATHVAFDMDVAAQSFDVMEVPQYGMRGYGNANFEICLPHWPLWLALGSLSLLLAVGTYLYIDRSGDSRKHRKQCPLPLPRSPLSS